MTISVASRKAKGRRLQQWVAKEISKITGFECGTDCEIESRPMGQNGPDIRLEKKVLEIFPYSIECKSKNLGRYQVGLSRRKRIFIQIQIGF